MEAKVDRPAWPADPELDRSLPLHMMKVVDVTQALAGPSCTEMLADMGADVIKIENPKHDAESRGGPPIVNGESTTFLMVNRNKRSITLNLKAPAGRDLLLQLATSADVLVQNFRPGMMERVGLGYETLRQINPAIVYCSISGFGQDGPYAHLGGYDAITQGMNGLMLSIGETGRPPVKAGVPLCDFGTGMFACYAILAAYVYRLRTGKGQHVSANLMDTGIALQVKQMMHYLVKGEVPRRMGPGDVEGGAYRAFHTKGGQWITIGGGAILWPRMCRALGAENLIDDPRFATAQLRSDNSDELVRVLQETLDTRPCTEWLPRFQAEGVPAGPVQTIDQAVVDPQVQVRQMIVEQDHPVVGKFKVIGIPVKLSKTPGRIRKPAPLLGHDTDSVLKTMGYGEQQISDWRKEGVV